MLRDSPCLLWQCCNDSRRQTDWRQDPLDYFVSDIKRSGYTQWGKIKGKNNERCHTQIGTTIKREQKSVPKLVEVKRGREKRQTLGVIKVFFNFMFLLLNKHHMLNTLIQNCLCAAVY